MRLLILFVLSALMHAGHSFQAGAPGGAGTALAFGYLLLTAYLVGGLFSRIRLPRLTGYIVTGIAVGPAVLGFIPEPALQNLKLVSGVAVALIALTAGTELELRAMRPLFRSIAWLTGVTVLGMAALLTATIYLARDLLPFMAGLSPLQAASVALVLGVVISAKSPAVVVALKKEMEADGPLTRTVLAVVVLGDLMVILMFAVATPIARAALGLGSGVLESVATLAWEIPGSFAAGILAGLLLSVYIRKVSEGTELFLLTVCFVIAEVGARLHLDPLLVALAAGIFIRNLTGAGERLHQAIDGSSLPVYVVFFAVAGATIHLDVLAIVGAPAVLLVSVRALGFLAGSGIATRLAGSPEAVRRYAGFGLLPQAGLALALSMLFAKTFPEFGAEAAALTLGIVAINEICAPALYRFALARSGEARPQPAPEVAPAGAEEAEETGAAPGPSVLQE